MPKNTGYSFYFLTEQKIYELDLTRQKVGDAITHIPQRLIQKLFTLNTNNRFL